MHFAEFGRKNNAKRTFPFKKTLLRDLLLGRLPQLCWVRAFPERLALCSALRHRLTLSLQGTCPCSKVDSLLIQIWVIFF